MAAPRMSSVHFPIAAAVFAACIFPSCAPRTTPEKAMATAYRYSALEWMPEQRHVRHGRDGAGIPVHTPDVSLGNHGDPRGYWAPGKAARGMPYKWGGFDTPESFLAGLERGMKAGDIGGPEKRKMDDAGVSAESVGIDCSGFVSRCWGLSRPYSTKELPGICLPLRSWEELRTGDILLKDGHVVLFKEWGKGGREVVGYEAGPFPKWRVSACGLSVRMLKEKGYAPWRYKRMRMAAKEGVVTDNRDHWEWSAHH